MTTEAVSVSRNCSLVDKPDLESLVAEYYPRILRAALIMTGNRWDAEDLAQETFLQAMSAWWRFARQSGVETWLYSILLNLHRKRLRSQTRRWRRWLAWFEKTHAQRDQHEPHRKLEEEEWSAGLWKSVAELPHPQQHAILLRFSENLSYEQISEVMNCPIGTVKSRLHSGLGELERRLRRSESKILLDILPELNSTRTAG